MVSQLQRETAKSCFISGFVPAPWLGPSFGSPAPSSMRRALGDSLFFFFFAQRLLKQPILVPLTLAKEILYELESVRKDLMRLS